MKWKRVLFTALLSAAMMFDLMPAAVFAEDSQPAKTPVVNVRAEGNVTVDDLDSDELLMQYIDRKVAEETGTEGGNTFSVKSVHQRRDSLDPVAKNMYDALAPSVREVAAGNRAETKFVVSGPDIFQRAKFDEEDLGVSPLFVGDKITADAFDAFTKKLTGILSSSLSDMMGAMISDMPYELYWLDNENGIQFEITEGWLESHMLIYSDGCIGVEPDDSMQITFNFFVSQDYSKGGSPSQYGPKRTTTADTEFTKAAARTAGNISSIIEKAGDEPDVRKMMMYKDEICRLTSYHPTAMKDPDFPYGDPWQLIYVFDGDPKTKVVCEGYSKAFQYLCDNTSFADKTVESRLVSGVMTGNVKGGVVAGRHMWNVVHMDDGHNYIADITNCDDENMTENFPSDVFLKQAISGSVNDGYVYRYQDGTLKYVYDEKIRRLFSDEELAMSDRDYPYEKGNADIDMAVLTFDLNGGELNGETGTVTMSIEIGTVITLPEPTRNGYDFDYWQGSKYMAGDKYTVSEDHTFKAIWTDGSGSGKRGSSARTGDDSHVILWISALVLAAVGLMVMLLRSLLLHRSDARDRK